MKVLLNVLIPKILPNVNFKCIAHEGKQDLEKSIPRKLRAWLEPDTYFVIVRDKDQADCIDLKKRLMQLCADSGRSDSLVRIACYELESWFLGDLAAVEQAFAIKNLSTKQQNKKYKDPDKLANASEELAKLVKGYRKISGAEKIAAYMNVEQNRSHSFNCFVRGVSGYGSSS